MSTTESRDSHHALAEASFSIGHAAALLEVLAASSGEVCRAVLDGDAGIDMQNRWLRVDYLARQLRSHLADLDKARSEVEA